MTGAPAEERGDTPRPPKKTWTSRSIGARWQHEVFYFLIRYGGRGAADLLLVFVVLYYTLFRPSVRNRSMFYLRRRFPERGALGLLWGSYRLSFGVGRVLVDRAVLGILGPQRLSIGLEGKETLAALVANGRGAVMVTAHVGCWQLAMPSLALLGKKVNIVMHREAGDVDRQFFEHGDGPPPYRIIDPAEALGGTLEMLQALKRGEVLSVMGDRVMGGKRSTIAVDFLGGKIEIPFSPYLLASASGSSLAVIFPYATGRGKYALKVARIIHVPEGLGRSAEQYRPYAEQFVAALEEFVAEHPYQFFNFYDLWSPGEPPR